MEMNSFWSQLIMNLALAFLPVIATALTAVLVAQFKKLWAQAQAARPDITAELEWIARTAVSAAEQAGVGKLSAEKKAYAISVAEKWLEMKGLTVDLDAIDAAIEAAVYQEINKDKQQPQVGA